MILGQQPNRSPAPPTPWPRQLVGLPTETVYGLAADADNDAAVARSMPPRAGRPTTR
jgi:L-threonylcarbamoyladenylate synthase